MKHSIAIVIVALFCLSGISAQANERKLQVIAPGKAFELMEVRVTTVFTRDATDTVIETIPIELGAADVMNPDTKAARIVGRINAVAGNVTAAVDATDASVVIIKSVAGRSISVAEVRPLKSGERDKLIALGPGEDPNAPVVLGLTLGGIGALGAFTGTVGIEGFNGDTFTVSTDGLSASMILSLLDAMIDASPDFESDLIGDHLSIVGALLGNNYSVFFDDSVGLSYGFSVASFPTAVREPDALALFIAGALAMLMSRRRVRAGWRLN